MKSIPSVRFTLIYALQSEYLHRAGHFWTVREPQKIEAAHLMLLIASSTVGVAATGFAFGRPQLSTPTRPTSNKRKATEYDMEHRVIPSTRSRPATGSTAASLVHGEVQDSSPLSISSRGNPPPSSDRTSPNEDDGNHVVHISPTPRRREIGSPLDRSIESRRDSFSSRNSWIRRLSTIQISSSGSPRSSVGPDSPSLTLSHGSAAPILQRTGSPASLPPNKLVKRSTSVRIPNGETPTRSGSKSRIPTLRRPATSHQRSVTLQQQFRQDEEEQVTVLSQQLSSSAPLPQRVIMGPFPPLNSRTSWQAYFKSRPTKLTKERPSTQSNDSNADALYSASRRIILPEGSTPPTLLKATMIIESGAKKIPSWIETFPSTEAESADINASAEPKSMPMSQTPDQEPHKRPRRSLSMPLSSASTWISRTGSLRSSKRGGNARTGTRYSSAPLASVPGRATISTNGMQNIRRKGIIDPTLYTNHNQESDEDQESQIPFASVQSLPSNDSSPLAPVTRLSSFNLDLMQVGPSSSSSAPRCSPIPPDYNENPTSPVRGTAYDRSQIKSSPRVIVHQSRSPRVSELNGSDQASTLVGSDTDNRGFTSGEEDEMDFKSDTVFDSYRTGTTGSIRSRNPPLEMMFDESPPSISHKFNTPITRDIPAGGAFRDSIVEEDEGMATPIKFTTSSDRDRYSTPIRDDTDVLSDDAMQSSPPTFSLEAKEFAQLSLEDEDEDEDWTKEDDSLTISNPLSPPSSSVNSRRVNSIIRTALADVTKTGSSSGNAAPSDDRPRSLFDWSEPLSLDKIDILGNSTRPKTVHGKHIVDHRGGRTVGRRGPSALHIRSQSVPVVPDATSHREHRKLAPKFGTWGLGGKGVNEDWDNDFEFDGIESEEIENGNESMSGSGMLVPPAIQASQANVVGHVGQIREVCLLVEDLKRLRGLGREKGILDGPSSALWREAEGIIALAIPDEEDEILSPPRSPSSFTLDYESIGDGYRDGGFDISELSGDNFLNGDTNGSFRSTGLVYDELHIRRQSVFSPEDDIFGAGGIAAAQRLGEEQSQSIKPNHQLSERGSSDVARSVMERIHQHRAISDPLRAQNAETSKKMPFDTTSLRDLVHRANALTRILAELIRKADGSSQSPVRSPHVDRDSSPAFTRVFTDPLASPPKHLPRSQSNNSILSGSIDTSPTRGLEKRMHIMTVV